MPSTTVAKLPEPVLAFLEWTRTDDSWGGLFIASIVIAVLVEPWLLAVTLLKGTFFSICTSTALKDPTNTNPAAMVGPSMIIQLTSMFSSDERFPLYATHVLKFQGLALN
jgi:hypothetical protein